MNQWTPKRLAIGLRASYAAFGKWYRTHRSSISTSVRVEPGLEDGQATTSISVSHRIPFGTRRAYYLVTNEPTRVGSEFGPRAREINTTAGHGRETGAGRHRRAGKGRVLFLVDLRSATGEVVAALGLHIEDRKVIVRCLGVRVDDASAHERSIVGLLVLKAYAHAIANKYGGTGELIARPDNDDDSEVLRRIGFRRESRASSEYRQQPYD